MIIGVTGGFHALALLFVGLRVYTRAAIVKLMGRDDYVAIASVVRLFVFNFGPKGCEILILEVMCHGRHDNLFVAILLRSREAHTHHPCREYGHHEKVKLLSVNHIFHRWFGIAESIDWPLSPPAQ